MTILALLLVIASAFAHATWNFLAKASRNPHAFTWAFNAVAALVYTPIAVIAARSAPPAPGAFLFISVTVALHICYFGLLGASYARADLSIVYPFARGTGLVLIPIGATLMLGEHLSAAGAAAIGIIVLGILTIHSRGSGRAALKGLIHSVRERGSHLAALTGVIIAAYSLWDKNALSYLSPVVLVAGIFTGQALVNAPLALTRWRQAVIREIRERPGAVIAAGILAPLAYLLVLIALTFSQIAYVAPAREIGIVIGTALGTTSLKEPHSINRLIGSFLIVTGVFGLAAAH
ncbi:MAG: EamA family transporter [Chloroflexi bacterium]|nr:EamA family transporter [Chloroflexota bacterium]